MTVRAHCMFSTFDPATNAVITSAQVNVYNPGTVTPISATIFDRLGNTLSNPLTSDATTGLIDFYLTVAQEVDLVVSKASFTTRTYSNVPVLDDSSLELTALLTTTGDIVYASSANSPARLPIGASGTLLHGGATPTYSGVAYTDVIATAFTTWANPAMSQGGSTPSLTVNWATYMQLGKLVVADLNVSVTSSGSAGNDIIVSTLPVAPKNTGAQAQIGSFTYLRSAVAVYVGSVVAVSSTNAKFYSNSGTGGGYLGNVNGPSFAPGSGDVLGMHLVYEAA